MHAVNAIIIVIMITIMNTNDNDSSQDIQVRGWGDTNRAQLY